MSQKNKKAKNKNWPGVTIDNNVRDYGNDPFVIKKDNDSKDFLEKHGFPTSLKKKRRHHP